MRLPYSLCFQARGRDAVFLELVRAGTARSPADRSVCELWEGVREAGAQARSAAEVEVRKANPEFWVRCGPGKARPGEPCWTERPAAAEMPDLTVIVMNN